MSVFIAWGNIHQSYPFEQIPTALLTPKLRQTPPEQSRLLQRYRCRWVAHFLLWELLKTAKISTALLSQIAYSQSQRPYFPDPTIDFNISHSGDWVAVMLSVNEKASQKQSAVGIDIEFPQKARDYTALLGYFASEQEQQWFAKQPDKKNAFYRIWCLREALLKSQGVGIVKLSEVDHQADDLQLFSAHCPQGEAIFTQELPFYLSAFANETLAAAHYFYWNDKGLKQIELKQKIGYKVNPTLTDF
ncbi:4'-phosphopantetheinyl transferase family protein [Avibacterium sp. 21-599]|uniref:4'-phosphopantetheinyl transferase family protein n=1 Tax=Avibacterium sp. 21-599 TaxID=2911528 RepID=UPI0022452FCD|nr:4'-phosphopantetheinyl transferase superfamily protein [Avibacterium sp. 21-599]MCW9719052.1 4'-phosphopantetheinyl transferase superfamily protein [Avibacterium sp. 21-599]